MDKEQLIGMGEVVFRTWLKRKNATSFEQVIHNEILKILEESKSDIIMKAMGFTNRWAGDWEISTSGSNPTVMSAAVLKEAKPLADTWMALALKGRVVLTKPQLLAIRQAVRDKAKDLVRQATYTLVREKVQEAIDKYIEEEMAETIKPKLEEFATAIVLEHGADW